MTPRRNALLLLGGAVLLSLTGPADSHVFSSTEDSEVRVVANPHCSGGSSHAEHAGGGAAEKDVCSASSSSSCEPQLFLSPHRIIRTPMITQLDTLVEITTKKVLSVPVPIYHFRQPARLSAAELPFQLVLVADVDGVGNDGLREIPVDPIKASDSWFPGYNWAPVVCASCDRLVHVGWKFVNPRGEFFYALIVDAKKEEKDAVRVGIGALGEAIADTLQIGMRAPAWMVDALTRIA